MEIIKIKSFLISDDKKLIIDTSLIETIEYIKGDNGFSNIVIKTKDNEEKKIIYTAGASEEFFRKMQKRIFYLLKKNKNIDISELAYNILDNLEIGGA